MVESPLSCLAWIASWHPSSLEEAWEYSQSLTESVDGDWLAHVWLHPHHQWAEVSSFLLVSTKGGQA